MFANLSAARVRPLRLLALLVGLLGIGLQFGSIVALVNGNLGHVALLKAQLSRNTDEQQQLLDSAQRQLVASLQFSPDDQAYTTAQLVLSPRVGCPQPSSIGPVSQQVPMGADTTRELAVWIETKSVIPVCLGAGKPDYAAGYYGYMWSEVIALDMLSQFKGHMLDQAVGARYRREILSQGGQREEMDDVRKFLGRDPSSEAFFAEITGRR